MRLFLSVDLPDDLAEAVADAQALFADAGGLRFTDPGQAHVTMKFLGETDEARVPAVEDAVETALDDAAVDPFDATVGGFGVFPSLDYISVVWTGVRGSAGAAELTRLHEAIERETTALGFEAEDHDFTPHVTLARMNDARGKDLVQRVVRERDPTIGTFRVREVRLKESTLGDDGPVYETVTRFSL
jgi:2'-5' RNA ligase